MKQGVVAAWVALAFAGCVTEAPIDVPPAGLSPDPERIAELEALSNAPVLVLDTGMGEIRLLLYAPHMPITTARIAELAESGFYDGTLIHRVVDDFVIQGGDPTGTGEGGSGQMIPFEAHEDLPFGTGALGMAQWTPGTADSQWFITEKPAPHLHDANGELVAESLGPYPMFGQVVAGMDVVRAISEVAVVPMWDRPVEEVRVTEASIANAEGVDLLALPQGLEANVQLAGGRFHVEQPLNLYANHSFTVRVTVLQAGDDDVKMLFRQPGRADVAVALNQLDGDTVLEGNVTLEAGDWEQVLRIGSEEKTWARVVEPWSGAYHSFA